MYKKVDILGVGIDKLTVYDCTERVRNALLQRKNTKIFTPNPSIVLKAHKDKKMKDLLNSADLLVADGTGLIQASVLLNNPLPQRIAGIDLGEKILESSVKEGLSIFLLGGKEGTALLAAQKLKERYDNLNIVGIHHGYFDADSDYNDKLVACITQMAPDIIFVCMGYPRQEQWIIANSDKISSLRLSIGLGGSLDVWSGKLKRAPIIFRKLNLEWLWRMIIDPKRFANLRDIPLFYYYVLKQKIKSYK